MSIDIQKLNPRNWFKHEREEESEFVPANRNAAPAGGRGYLPSPMRQDPFFARFEELHREIDDLFENMLAQSPLGQSAWGFPRLAGGIGTDTLPGAVLRPSVDITEEKQAYKIAVEVPGVDEDDVKLELEGNALIIRGEKREEKQEEADNRHYIERSYGAFRRILTLPDDADAENIGAEFKKGVLTVTVPRRNLSAHKDNVRRIEVKKAA